MDVLVDLKLLLLLAVANGVPVLANSIMGRRLAHPLDFRIRFLDGRPLLGTSKTVRGVVLSLVVTALVAPLMGIAWPVGLVAAAGAMIGDLLSSFLKRRAGVPVSGMALGLDQLPESLIPALACMGWLSLTLLDVAAICACFLVGELLLSRVFYRLHLRDRPY